MVAAALAERGPNLDYDLRIAQAQDPKLRAILREEQRQEQMELFRTRVLYLTVASVEFAAAAFVAGRARKSRASQPAITNASNTSAR